MIKNRLNAKRRWGLVDGLSMVHYYIILVFLVTGCSNAPKSTLEKATPDMKSTRPTDTPTANWKLVWSDEFDQANGSSVDPTHWSFNTGAGGWGNGEYEYYTERIDNAYIENGALVIKAQKENFKNSSFTSARLVTRNKGDWTYGRVEIRARLPFGQGIWPAIWMLPTDNAYGGWPRSGEIDIMELIGNEPSRVYGTLHYGSPHKSQGSHYDLPGGVRFADDYHLFALEWEPEEIRWYVDGYQYQTVSQWFTSSTKSPFPAPFDRRFHIVMNVAVGGTWPGYPDETTQFPQMMYIDYVRVYQIGVTHFGEIVGLFGHAQHAQTNQLLLQLRKFYQ